MKILLTFCLIITGSNAVTTVTGYRGRSVQIKCHYESGYEENNKYLCRGKCPHWPAYRDVPISSGSPAVDTRFSLYDNTTAKIFTFTITDLRAEDANTYWCGIEQPGIDKYTEIQLVIMDNPASTVSPNTHSASTLSMSVSVHKSTQSTFSSTGHNNEPSSAKSLLEKSTIIVISVGGVLVLLLIALLSAVVIQRKKKTKAQSPQSKNSSNNCVAPTSYQGHRSNSLHFTDESTTPSDVPQPIYSNIGVPKVSSDFSIPVYAQVKRPGHQDVHSTAQLTSDPSVNAAQTSGESIMYTAVSFDTRSSVVGISKNETSCDYSTVKLNECG
ncbi:CMRF35-like molecule 3 isoform X2 [Silurus meridionalis]|uniref:Immunoglobulin domain-containing protein n=1 Tax=Silurus meridionalis TaxID=175797 RepID=A0A8T0ADL3_SILME|nr:CMRF35-like molecule 3 isoform X1 [Silurus meridionalis]XP_046694064.1 CMRF35-like molecule 3 isoform X2 [Silurus meridionalis]KAF7689238.1 hypothetical protein HF521_012591 [Silurus meridionalis]